MLCALTLGASACDTFIEDLIHPRDPNWCPDVPYDENCLNPRPDAPSGCASSSECAPLVCDVTGSRTCVSCTAAEHGACTGMTPVCGASNACRGCSAHAECDSRVCLPDGSCAVSEQVAYVEPLAGGNDSGGCTLALPCVTIGRALATGRPYVKLAGTMFEQVTLIDRTVAFHAEPGARLTSTSAGSLLRVEGTSDVMIYDLEISGAVGATSGFGILANSGTDTSISLTRVKLSGNQAGGLFAVGSKLAISQSTISSNAGGGVSFTNGTFVIVGNFFFKNGSDTAAFGGISIIAAQGGASRLEFNSFHANQAQATIAAGVQCAAGTFTARNNIISANVTPTNQAQTGGSCTHEYSIIRPGTLPPGTGNSALDPLFRDAAIGDLHLRHGSPAHRRAAPYSVLTGIAERDIDGDPRISPASLGADEPPR